MTDEPDETAHAPTVVNVAEPWTRAHWARVFAVPVEQVEAAVAAVGSEPERVAEYLGRSWPFEASGIV